MKYRPKLSTLRKHRITLADFETMLAEQNGVCAICGAARKRLFIDHCHKTGHVRALLCLSCNGSVGRYEAGPAFRPLSAHMQKVAAYVDDHNFVVRSAA